MTEQFAIEASGDPDEDAQRVERARRSLRLRSEGMCPNGHGPLRPLSAFDLGCPACPFRLTQNVPHRLDRS